MQLMRDIRESIKQDKFPEFVQRFMKRMFPDNIYPDWAQKALASVNILLDSQQTRLSDSKQQTLLTKHDNNTSGECVSSIVSDEK